MPPSTSVPDEARRLLAAARVAHQRRVLVLSGEAAWAVDAAAGLREVLAVEDALWIGQSTAAGWSHCPPREGQAQLGREYGLICLDAFSGLDPDTLGAATGTLAGGGLFYLLCPPLDRWADYPDPERARMAVVPDGEAAVGGRFLRRLASILSAAPGVRIVTQAGEVMGDPLAVDPVSAAPTIRAAGHDGALTADQHAAVAAVLHAAQGHRRRPAVLTAHRGRGKSTAFGLAAAALLAERESKVVLTGPSLVAVAPVFAAAAQRLPGAHLRRGLLQYGTGRLEFMAPDALAEAPPQADLVLVDEAAALPLPLLSRLLHACPRLAFATTVHGYEGSGRAFALRFQPLLDRERPGWHGVALDEPIRWTSGDPLESLSFRALLLDAEPAADTEVGGAAAESLRIERLDRDALAADEPLLRELFGLLILAHYRTRPYDLRQLLDGPSVSVWVGRSAGRVAAVALLADEGGLDGELAGRVAAGRRRARGHLLPQVLAAHCARPDAMALRGRRVLRLAVHPAVRRRGLASALLARLAADAQADGLDWLGASFGATSELLAFWRGVGFAPLRVGSTREATSGAHAALVMRPLSVPAERLYGDLRARYLDALPHLLCDALRRIEPELALALLSRGDDECVVRKSTPAHRYEAAAFAAGGMDYEDVLGALWHLGLERLPVLTEPAVRDAFVARILQKRSWQDVATLLGVPGRRQVVELLRRAAASLLA
ncbi:hypothetical protein BJI67_13855 [Acidihalobacter aeolianus]|uniref:tRNA(Met) cytidine acetyltransferase TmcA n=1 Tax=Acidihalobacter aeolianus TaxID=2792603 RepID=A0A1D8KAK4_9GAMM|nr:GNAT family N-acetyltransferase [Acidihalobacter aeolianus]AOV17999.1 hypothetical protein BJI67_13855 [Acidihalobacter aeolianus]